MVRGRLYTGCVRPQTSNKHACSYQTLFSATCAVRGTRRGQQVTSRSRLLREQAVARVGARCGPNRAGFTVKMAGHLGIGVASDR